MNNKTAIIGLIILSILAVGSYILYTYSIRPSGEKEIALAKCLTGEGTILYARITCSHCADQKNLFGKDAIKYLKIIDCAKSPDICIDKGIGAVPTWEIKHKKYPGTRTLEELASYSGCQYSQENS